MEELKYWRISYLPATSSGSVVEWTFFGTKKELDEHLNLNHCCGCEGCKGKDWWDTPQSAEYIIEEVEGRFEQRYVFVSDDDGHNYMIPVELRGLFNTQVELDWDDPENKFDDLFEEYRIDSVSGITFTNPK